MFHPQTPASEAFVDQVNGQKPAPGLRAQAAEALKAELASVLARFSGSLHGVLDHLRDLARQHVRRD